MCGGVIADRYEKTSGVMASADRMLPMFGLMKVTFTLVWSGMTANHAARV